jgi:hypothetical protein
VAAREDVLPDKVAACTVCLIPLIWLRNHLQAQCATPLAVHGVMLTLHITLHEACLTHNAAHLAVSAAYVGSACQQNVIKIELRLPGRSHTWTMALPPGFRAASMAVK